MTISFLPIDDNHEKNPFTILVGKDMLVMFKPSSSLLLSNKHLAQLIAKTDLIKDKNLLDKLRSLQLLTDQISEEISLIIQIKNFKLTEGVIRDISKSTKDNITAAAKKISEIEDEIKLYVAEDHRIYFCNNCGNYIGLATDPLPEKCQICGSDRSKKISDSESLRYLDGNVRGYLQGIWLQDYVAKILKRMGWETWTECSVMGASGVYHPIDILAIDKNKGRVVIAECKRTAKGDDAFKLAAQFQDIQPSFGLLIAITKLDSEHGRTLLNRKPGLKLIEVENCSDEEIQRKLEEYILRDN